MYMWTAFYIHANVLGYLCQSNIDETMAICEKLMELCDVKLKNRPKGWRFFKRTSYKDFTDGMYNTFILILPGYSSS